MIGRQDAHMGRGRQVGSLALVFALAAAGCSRQPGVAASPAASTGQQLPFERVSDSKGISPTGELTSVGIPAGTPILIRLLSPLSSAEASAGDRFDAVLDESVIVQGQTVAGRGASISGKVVAATAGDERHAGYLRLTLSAIIINGKMLPLQTSSVFAKGGVSNEKTAWTSYRSDKDVKFSTERRLRFRVAQSVSVQN